MRYSQSSRSSDNRIYLSEARASHVLLVSDDVEWHSEKTVFLNEIKGLRYELGLQTQRYNSAKQEVADLVARLQAQPPPPPIPTRIEKEMKAAEDEGERMDVEEETPASSLPPAKASTHPLFVQVPAKAESIAITEADILAQEAAQSAKSLLAKIQPVTTPTAERIIYEVMLETNSVHRWASVEKGWKEMGLSGCEYGGEGWTCCLEITIEGEQMVAMYRNNGRPVWEMMDEKVKRYALHGRMEKVHLLLPKKNMGQKGYVYGWKTVAL